MSKNGNIGERMIVIVKIRQINECFAAFVRDCGMIGCRGGVADVANYTEVGDGEVRGPGNVVFGSRGDDEGYGGEVFGGIGIGG